MTQLITKQFKLKMILCLAVLGCLQVVAKAQTPTSDRPTKPNVLLILSDDLNTALSGYGHAECKTPNLDRLAARGVQFDNMHCQFPLCGPSRCSIMTGLYPYTTKVLINPVQFRSKSPDAVTLPQLFRNNGYHVARVSKIYHMGIPAEIRGGTAEYDDPQSWDEVINIRCSKIQDRLKTGHPARRGLRALLPPMELKVIPAMPTERQPTVRLSC